MRTLWKNFLAGFVVILPAFLTITILQVIFGWIYGLTVGPVAALISPWVIHGWRTLVVRVVIALVMFLLIAFIGFGTRILILRRFFSFWERLFRRVPMVGKIYQTIQEIANAFKGGEKGVFSRVVLLEWPRKGLYAIGFITSDSKGELLEKMPKHVLSVFIPHTPTPTTGFLILADRESVIELDMSVEDGLKLVISAGMVGPEVVKPEKSP